MNRDGIRVLVPAIASIACVIAATLMMDWFVVSMSGFPEIDKITIDLREARACSTLGPCVVLPMSMIKGGVYPTLAAITFFGSLGFGLLVLYQAGSRLLGGFSNESLTRGGHAVGSLMIVATFGAGYLFAPDIAPGELKTFGIDVDRTWGPSMLMLGLLLGHIALFYARGATSVDDAAYDKLDPKVPVARALPPATSAEIPTLRPTRAPATPPIAVARTKSPTIVVPLALRKKVKFAIASAEVTIAGIDARREAGDTMLVMWRDVVGLVARRLPPELEGHSFVDIVSTAGMTLRILPWTKLTGDPIEADGDGPDARARAFVQMLRPRCREAKLDRATQLFLDHTDEQPAQLNMDLLSKHDQALA